MEMKNKRGVFFTTAAIIIIFIFLLSYSLYSNYQERKSIEKRVTTMDSFLFSMEKDLSRQTYISGYRIIYILEKRIIETGEYITNLNASISEGFFNGTMFNNSEEILQGATFSDIQSSLSEQASKANLNIELKNPSIEMTQLDPWNVALILRTDLIMNDESNLARWNKTETTISLIPIENFEDPLYFISTSGKITKNITRSPFTKFVSGVDFSNLTSEYQNSLYISSTTAPSFLDRLQGINYPSQNGVESLVNLQYLSQQGISIQNKSVVDYIYFSSSNPTSYHVAGMPSWFRLDSPHVDIYLN